MAIRKSTIINARKEKQKIQSMLEDMKMILDSATGFYYEHRIKEVREGKGINTKIGHIGFTRDIWDSKGNEKLYRDATHKANQLREEAVKRRRKLQEKLYNQL